MGRPKKQVLVKRPDGRYRAKYLGKEFYSFDMDEALRMRDEYKAQVESGERVISNQTVHSYASSWLPVHKASVSKNTYSAYSHYLELLTMKLGGKALKDVTPSDIKEVYNLFIGKSESSIKKAKMLYVDLWDCAIEDGYTKYNPCRSKGALPHKGASGTHRALTPEEDEMILSTPADLRLAVLLMRYAGLRRGEVFDFDIDQSVDFNRKVITVSSAVRFEGNKGVLSDPKTEAGKREVPLLDILAKELKDHHGKICPLKKVSIMTSSAWRAMWDHYILQLEAELNGCPQRRWFHLTREWKRSHPEEYAKYYEMREKSPISADEYRLRDWQSVTIRPHDLRHSFCTMLRDAGVDIKLAIKWMGHADEKMILRIYDHGSPDREQRNIQALNNSVNKGSIRGSNVIPIRKNA